MKQNSVDCTLAHFVSPHLLPADVAPSGLKTFLLSICDGLVFL